MNGTCEGNFHVVVSFRNVDDDREVGRKEDIDEVKWLCEEIKLYDYDLVYSRSEFFGIEACRVLFAVISFN